VIWTLAFTFFLDFVGLFMVAPIFSPLLLSPESAFFTDSISHLLRTAIIGLLVASYGLAQFFGGPFLGELSDQFGRKKVLLLGLWTLTLGNLLGGISLAIHDLPLLFFSRLAVGFSSGNGAVLFAAATSMGKSAKEKGIYLGYITGSGALGCVLGPLMGGHLSNPSIVSWFSPSTPFYFITLLSLLNILLIAFLYQDRGIYQRRSFHPFIGLKNVYESMKTPKLRTLLLVYFLFVLSTESLFVSLPIYAVEIFQVNMAWLGNMFAIGGAMSAVTSLIFNRMLSQKLSSYALFFFSMLALSVIYLLVFIPKEANGLFIIYGIFGIAAVLAWTHGNANVAEMGTKETQGKLLGVAQSLLSLSIILGPAAVGLIASLHPSAAILLSELSALFGLVLFGWYWKKSAPQ
jgi:DHA1 family tetracycline resistance protein-like MFS transporter